MRISDGSSDVCSSDLRRRAEGLPATCVRWGAIDDVGYLARNKKIKDALQSRMGGAALASEAALQALESMLLADASGLGVLELDWRALRRFLPSAATRSEEHTSELQSLMRISYTVFCL